jgi:hypothetical protein
MNIYNLKQRVGQDKDYITVKMASNITGMTANAIRVAGYAGRIDMVRSGTGGQSSIRRYHNEVSLASLYDYIATKDTRGRKPKLCNVGSRGGSK